MAIELSGIRLVVSDIDGTLVKNDKSLAPETVEAVRRVRAAGIGFTIISARPPSGLGPLIAELGLDGPAGAFNGATIFRPGGEVVEAHHIDEDAARGIVAIHDRLGIPVWVFADGRWMTRTREMPHVDQEIVAARQDPVVTPDFERWMSRADKVQGISDDSDLLTKAEDELKASVGERATIARSQHYYLDATAPHTDKGHGVRELAKAFGVPLEAVAVLGDMPNDLPMFRVAGVSVAMGQAPDEVKAEADQITKSNEDNGVAAFLEFLGK
ncbi:Cof-type HAD-IIB family hydrolase [Aureimonas leprariae]|uniref:HAD family phosphatase n=1 Tax=Plantimonas leprariae TaxID=2615207 RepID=A0A7V7PPF0_9HYPH|nr:Cof-type HAD-IIB family hydrolase [Aureimonas leprariae]KAB0679752.1 HAD family phosphatase [Aureimonas leprariae]